MSSIRHQAFIKTAVDSYKTLLKPNRTLLVIEDRKKRSKLATNAALPIHQR